MNRVRLLVAAASAVALGATLPDWFAFTPTEPLRNPARCGVFEGTIWTEGGTAEALVLGGAILLSVAFIWRPSIRMLAGALAAASALSALVCVTHLVRGVGSIESATGACSIAPPDPIGANGWALVSAVGFMALVAVAAQQYRRLGDP